MDTTLYKWVKEFPDPPFEASHEAGRRKRFDGLYDYFEIFFEDETFIYEGDVFLSKEEFEKRQIEWQKPIPQSEVEDITLSYKHYSSQGRTLEEAVNLLGEIIEVDKEDKLQKAIEENTELKIVNEELKQDNIDVHKTAWKLLDDFKKAIDWCDEKIKLNTDRKYPMSNTFVAQGVANAFEEMKQFLIKIK